MGLFSELGDLCNVSSTVMNENLSCGPDEVSRLLLIIYISTFLYCFIPPWLFGVTPFISKVRKHTLIRMST